MLFRELQMSLAVLLQALGVVILHADGEAEALCGHLNELGIVDAVVSNDADAFLYGAKTLLVNFGGGDKVSRREGDGESDGEVEGEG